MIGVIIGCLISIIGIIITLVIEKHRNKYPKRMKFYILDAVRLTNPMVDKLEDIKLEYNGQRITNKVSYIKGLFYNEGDEDIILKENETEEGLTIELPSGYKWLSVIYKEHSDRLKVEFDIDKDNTSILHISSRVFKRAEIFSFDAFVEGEIEKRQKIKDKIKISHRFFNTAPIETETMYDIVQENESKKFVNISSSISIISLILMIFSSYILSTNAPARFKEKGVAGDSIVAYAAYVCPGDSIAIVEDVDILWPWNNNRFSIEEFNEKFEVTTYISKDGKIMRGIMYVFIVLFALIIILLVWVAISENQRKKVRRIYRKIQKKSTRSIDEGLKKDKEC